MNWNSRLVKFSEMFFRYHLTITAVCSSPQISSIHTYSGKMFCHEVIKNQLGSLYFSSDDILLYQIFSTCRSPICYGYIVTRHGGRTIEMAFQTFRSVVYLTSSFLKAMHVEREQWIVTLWWPACSRRVSTSWSSALLVSNKSNSSTAHKMSCCLLMWSLAIGMWSLAIGNLIDKSRISRWPKIELYRII